MDAVAGSADCGIHAQRLLVLTYPAIYLASQLALPYLSALRFFRMFGVAVHEMGHAAAGTFALARVRSISVDAMEGGGVRLHGTALSGACCRPSVQMALVAPAGYLTEAGVGAAMLLGGARAEWAVATALVACALLLVASMLVALQPRLRYDAVCLLAWAAVGALASVRAGPGSPVGWLFPLFTGCGLLAHAAHDVHDDTVRRVVPSSDATIFALAVLGDEQHSWLVGAVWWTACQVAHLGALAGLYLLLGTWHPEEPDCPVHPLDAFWWYAPAWAAAVLSALGLLTAALSAGWT